MQILLLNLMQSLSDHRTQLNYNIQLTMLMQLTQVHDLIQFLQQSQMEQLENYELDLHQLLQLQLKQKLMHSVL